MAFAYRLEREHGMPAEPPTLRSSVSSWHAGGPIPLGRDRTLRVIDTQLGDEPDDDPVLVVEPV